MLRASTRDLVLNLRATSCEIDSVSQDLLVTRNLNNLVGVGSCRIIRDLTMRLQVIRESLSTDTLKIGRRLPFQNTPFARPDVLEPL